MKIGTDVELDTLLAAKVLIGATLKQFQAGSMFIEVEDSGVSDPDTDKPLKVRITLEVVDE